MASTLPKWSGRKDAQAKLELTPFRAKDALSSHHLEEVHNIADQEYGGQPARTPKQWWEFLQHQGGWLLATAHIVTAIIGAGVLGLPYALSWLGWVGGMAMLVLFYAVSAWCSLLLVECHETDGVRHPTYRAAALQILGYKSAVAVSIFQALNLVLSSIGYTVAAGQSLRILVGAVCSRSRFEHCYDEVWHMSLGFGAVQLLLSQLPNLESAWWTSIIGALMSFMYSTCALGLGASQGRRRLAGCVLSSQQADCNGLTGTMLHFLAGVFILYKSNYVLSDSAMLY
eukprot:GHRR01007012.1.p1 GENE.GHRR01007012.1~~GHRR01007012.1.p1  ORF type:complete len:285 (+),score=58.74 GHRR01007012.1:338-1192(+)